MLNTDYLTILGLGFLLGLRHALDTDHLAAISTMLAQRPSWRASSLVGLSWGVGHATMLLGVGAVVLLLQIRISEALAQAAEFAVGGMLVLLGGHLGVRLLRERWHVHRHDHDGMRHVHFHSHALTSDHGHPHWLQNSIRPLCVGMAHGLAGSAALLLVVLGSSHTTLQGFGYIAVFGIGSILGMLVLGLAMSLPLVWSQSHVRPAFLALQSLASMGSIAIGLSMMIHVALGGQVP